MNPAGGGRGGRGDRPALHGIGGGGGARSAEFPSACHARAGRYPTFPIPTVDDPDPLRPQARRCPIPPPRDGLARHAPCEPRQHADRHRVGAASELGLQARFIVRRRCSSSSTNFALACWSATSRERFARRGGEINVAYLFAPLAVRDGLGGDGAVRARARDFDARSTPSLIARPGGRREHRTGDVRRFIVSRLVITSGAAADAHHRRRVYSAGRSITASRTAGGGGDYMSAARSWGSRAYRLLRLRRVHVLRRPAGRLPHGAAGGSRALRNTAATPWPTCGVPLPAGPCRTGGDHTLTVSLVYISRRWWAPAPSSPADPAISSAWHRMVAC